MALSQKDIDNLEIKDKAYLKPVGKPKELYIKIYPTSSKAFQIKKQKTKAYETIVKYKKCSKFFIKLTKPKNHIQSKQKTTAFLYAI